MAGVVVERKAEQLLALVALAVVVLGPHLGQALLELLILEEVAVQALALGAVRAVLAAQA
jgi:hypothetical protein